MVFPVMIGGGKRPFPESQQKKTFKPAGTQLRLGRRRPHLRAGLSRTAD